MENVISKSTLTPTLRPWKIDQLLSTLTEMTVIDRLKVECRYARGYGDSTGVPSETGAVEDIITLHNFIRSYQSTARIYLWGHSLGTGVSTHAAKVLSEFKSPPEGLILEAPFRNIIQAAREYIIAPLFYNNNWIIERSEAAVKEIGILFNNEEK